MSNQNNKLSDIEALGDTEVLEDSEALVASDALGDTEVLKDSEAIVDSDVLVASEALVGTEVLVNTEASEAFADLVDMDASEDEDILQSEQNEQIIAIQAEENSIRLDAWLSIQLKDMSRTYLKKLIEEQRVLVNGHIEKSKYKVQARDEIVMTIPAPELLDVVPEEIPLDIYYEDNDLLIVNKPKGMVVHPAAGHYTGTLVNAVMFHCGNSLSDINGVIRPGIVHRIDKDTTGLLVVAKNNLSHEYLSELFKKHDIVRKYIALVEGVIQEETGKINLSIGRHPSDRKKMAVNALHGRQAVSYFKVLNRYRKHTLVEVTLETGRTHQIRVHMAHIGFPVAGDTVYGRKNPTVQSQGQLLHAAVLGFKHPRNGEQILFEAPLPSYFQDILGTL